LLRADEKGLVEGLIEKMEKYVLRSEALKEEQLKIIQKHGPNQSPPFCVDVFGEGG
jgi:hypothetical protein